MLVACRLAGLSALGAHYAGVKLQAMRAEHGTTHQDNAGTSHAAPPPHGSFGACGVVPGPPDGTYSAFLRSENPWLPHKLAVMLVQREVHR